MVSLDRIESTVVLYDLDDEFGFPRGRRGVTSEICEYIHTYL